MRLVGASDAFIRWPFVFEGAFVGFLGAVITLVVLAAAAEPLGGFMTDFFRVLPLQVGSLTPGPVRDRHGRRRRARHPRLVAVRSDVPHSLDRAIGRPSHGAVYRSSCPSLHSSVAVSSEVRRTMSRSIPSTPHVRRVGPACHDTEVPIRPRSPPDARAEPPGAASPPSPRATVGDRRSCSARSPSWRVLAGGALFMSGYALGARARSNPGPRSPRATAFQPFWDTYHTITDRYAGGAGRSRGARPGRDQRHDRVARRPVLGVPHAPTSTARACRGSAASSRGSAPRSRPRRPDGTHGLRDARDRPAGS